MSINCDLVVYNATTSDILASVTTASSSGLLTDITKYDVAITRLKADISNAPIMLINPNDDSTSIQIELDCSPNGSGADITISSGPIYLQNDIYSPADFTQEINKALAFAYSTLIVQFPNSQSSQITTTNTFTQVAPSKILALGPSIAGDHGAGVVTLQMSGFTSLTATTYYNIDLENPSGTIARVASNILLSNGPTNNYTFAIYGISQESIMDGVLSSGTYVPVDSFLKFNGQSFTGNWKVYITNAGLTKPYSIIIDNLLLTVSSIPQSSLANGLKFPPIPAHIEYNEQNYITWRFHELYFWNKIKFKLGTKLQNILRINKRPSEYLEVPDQVLSNTLDQVIAIQQELPCLAYIAELQKVLIVSTTLPISKDFTSNDNRSQAIFSLQLDTDAVLTYNTVEYDISQEPWRRYPFISQGELREFTISLQLQYVDGTVKDLYLQPKQAFSILVSFLSNGK